MTYCRLKAAWHSAWHVTHCRLQAAWHQLCRIIHFMATLARKPTLCLSFNHNYVTIWLFLQRMCDTNNENQRRRPQLNTVLHYRPLAGGEWCDNSICARKRSFFASRERGVPQLFTHWQKRESAGMMLNTKPLIMNLLPRYLWRSVHMDSLGLIQN